MKRLMLPLAAAALTLAAALPATAGAKPKTAEAQADIISIVKTAKNGTATVKAQYTCPDGFHLWVSAKQAASRERDASVTLPGAGETGGVAAWWQSHPDPSQFTCDGKKHTGTFTIDTTEQGYGQLAKGWAYVQFCLIGSQFISQNEWVKVN